MRRLQGSAKKVSAFSKSHNRELIDLFGGQWRTMVMVALGTGLRRSELCGLKWDSVTGSELRVRRALVQAGKTLTLKTPKTEGSERCVTLPDSLVTELRTHRARQAEQQLYAGEAYLDEGYVFAMEDGRPIQPIQVTQFFRRAVKDTKFQSLHIHSLRHCHASQLIADNINIKTISERLGHSSIVITLDTYGHLLPGMDAAAADAINASLA